jgi:hypothetical protein
MTWNPETECDLLSTDECRQVRETLHSLQSSWLVRRPAVPFYTLGAASYLDARGGFDGYQTLAARFNPMLQEHFGWLHERLAARLAEHLGEPVKCSPGLALPGFHIYLGCKLFEQAIASIHFDLQYDLVNWGEQAHCDFSRPLSFTLPVALPKTGGGLTTWNLDYSQTGDLEGAAYRAAFAAATPRYHAYATGRLFVHSGHTLHQAAPGRDLKLTDERITLQGHAVRCGGKWQLYW